MSAHPDKLPTSSLCYGNGFTLTCVHPGELLAAAIGLLAVSIIVFGLRIAARITSRTRFGWDDALAAVALVALIGMSAAMIIGVRATFFGYPAPYWPDGFPNEDGQLVFTLEVLQTLVFGPMKISLLFFYRRVFAPLRHGIFDITTKIVIAILVVWTVTYTLLNFFGCGTHIDWNWLPVPVSYCLGNPVLVSQGVTDLALDLMAWSLPFFVIWRLHLSIPQKISVSGTFCVGACAVAASGVRMVVVIEASMLLFTDAPEDGNMIWSVWLYWTMVEAGISFIAVCMPTLWPLVRNPRNRIRKAQLQVARLGSVVADGKLPQHHHHHLGLARQDDTLFRDSFDGPDRPPAPPPQAHVVDLAV